jgi:hypothetical protein
MKEPIKTGDLCEVVGGLGQGKSPNAGKMVTVVKMKGEHSKFGIVWQCEGDGVVQLGETGNYLPTGWADFPVAWLRKIHPPSSSGSTSTEKALSA